MKIGIIGSGGVAKTLAAKLSEIGHNVMLGTRQPEKLQEWLGGQIGTLSAGSTADAARQGEIVLNATAGTGSLEALAAAGEESLAGKVLLDLANPLDFSKGMPATLTVVNTDSLGEQIQRAFPRARVVKALNTVNAAVMVDPTSVAGGEHQLFICGNDAAAKADVAEKLRAWFGWKHILDLGDISGARGMEMYLPLWLRLMGTLGTPRFNIRIAR